MTKQTSKDQLLIDIRTERKRLEKNLLALKRETKTQSGVVGTWSVKDMLAHLVAWEQLFLNQYQAGLRDDSPAILPVGMSRKVIDVLNQEIYEKNRRRHLDDVLAEFRSSYQQILAAVEAIPEEDMFVHGRFTWTGGLTLADYIAGNTSSHYAWAKDQLRKWVKREAIEKQERLGRV